MVYELVESALVTAVSIKQFRGLGGTFCNGLYRETARERGTFFGLQVNKKVEISLVQVYKKG